MITINIDNPSHMLIICILYFFISGINFLCGEEFFTHHSEWKNFACLLACIGGAIALIVSVISLCNLIFRNL